MRYSKLVPVILIVVTLAALAFLAPTILYQGEDPIVVNGDTVSLDECPADDILVYREDGGWSCAPLDSASFPTCSEAEPTLQWRTSGFRCTATTTNTDFGISDTITASALAGYLTAAYAAGGNTPSSNGEYIVSFNANRSLSFRSTDTPSVATLGLENGYVWVIAPNWTDWIDDYTFTLQDLPTITIGSITVERSYLLVNGVPFDIAYAQMSGDLTGISNNPFLRRVYTPPATTTTVTVPPPSQ